MMKDGRTDQIKNYGFYMGKPKKAKPLGITTTGKPYNNTPEVTRIPIVPGKRAIRYKENMPFIAKKVFQKLSERNKK